MRIDILYFLKKYYVGFDKLFFDFKDDIKGFELEEGNVVYICEGDNENCYLEYNLHYLKGIKKYEVALLRFIDSKDFVQKYVDYFASNYERKNSNVYKGLENWEFYILTEGDFDLVFISKRI